jgi:ubiquinone/menaquinone biosynthesis C-methylase UbiE
MSRSSQAPPGVLSAAKGSGEPFRWPLPPALEHSPKVAYRNDHAKVLACRSMPELVGNYVYLSLPEMRRLVALARRYVLSEPLHGIGIEVGAGCGLLSSVVAEAPPVRQILALEICEQAAALIIPRVAEWVLGSQAQKVVPVVGSFDDLQLPDGTLDFVVEIDSLHHADDLTATLRECGRVLKPGGRVLCIDRCHPDSVTDREVEEMLSVVYSRQFLIANHYPPDAILTRRDNGEHEYRLFEWKTAFQAAGLRLAGMASFELAISPRAALKGMLSLLPRSVRRRLYRSDGPTPRSTLQWLVQQLRAATGYYRRRGKVLAPKQTTVFALVKP